MSKSDQSVVPHAAVIIFGEGHLAQRVATMVRDRGYEPMTITGLDGALQNPRISLMQALTDALRDAPAGEAKLVYLLHHSDKDNLKLLLAMMTLMPETSICTTLYNEALYPDLLAARPGLHILNPAMIAAEAFLAPLKNAGDPPSPAKKHRPKTFRVAADRLLASLVISFAALALAATAYFQASEHLSWIDSLYFVVVTITTVGYGDISLHHSSDQTKVAGILLMIASTVFMWLIFSLLIDRLVRRRVQHALGRRPYHHHDHIILCGLGRLGYHLAHLLHAQGVGLIIIERDDQSEAAARLRAAGVAVYAGDATKPQVLQDAGVSRCRALVSAINDDTANLQIALTARHYQPGVVAVLRIFDAALAGTLTNHFNLPHTASVSALVAARAVALLPDGREPST